jgi:hypothetical protein
VSELRWSEVNAYLQESEGALLAEVRRNHRILHRSPSGGWSVAQIVQHLVRTEQFMYPIWTVLPTFRKVPTVVRIADAANARLWRLMGMRTVESAGAGLTPANAAKGRYRAPVFLRPSNGGRDADQLIAWRRRTRDRSLRAMVAVDEKTLNAMRWSHPLLGSFTLMEFAQFLGIHERHHLPQIRRIEESLS